jgi:hypothetical protein
MNTNEFRKNLVARFISGAEQREVKDGFYILNFKDIKVSWTDDGFQISNDKSDRNEIIIYEAVQDFMKNLKIGLNAGDMLIPDYLQEAFDNDVDFSDDFVNDVMLTNAENK